MIPHVSTDIYEDTVSFQMPLNDSEFLCFVEFSYEVMRLKKVTTILHKKSKVASIFISGY